MDAIKEVESAKALMREAVNWSVVRWLAEKKRVRRAADVANELLDENIRRVKAGWSEELKSAYASLGAGSAGKNPSGCRDAAMLQLAREVKQADDAAYRARMDAEDTFDLAEKRLSTATAREGTRKAILSWEMHERALALARSGVMSGKLS